MFTWNGWLGRSRIYAALAGAFVLTALVALAGSPAPPAKAATFGQLSDWGAPGNSPGTFQNPHLLGVEPTTESVYVGDLLGVRIAKTTTLPFTTPAFRHTAM